MYLVVKYQKASALNLAQPLGRHPIQADIGNLEAGGAVNRSQNSLPWAI